MFAQVITGRAADRAGLRKESERWRAELAPGAKGYLGGTGGVTADGRLVVVALFEDAASARANSQRAEQDAWWQAFASHLDGEATFAESERIDLFGQGYAAQAGFVQVMQGRPDDPQEMRRLMDEAEGALREARPDLLGVVSLWHDDGSTTDVAYFTSEAEAREGERRPLPEALQPAFERMLTSTRDRRYFDLTDPWHMPPADA